MNEHLACGPCDLSEHAFDLRLLLRLYARVENRAVVIGDAGEGGVVEAFVGAGCPSIHAFEPNPLRAAGLQRRFRDVEAVRVFPMALGAREEAVVLPVGEDGSEPPTGGALVPVPGRSLGSLVEDGTLPAAVGVLKIATGRNDLDVVKGIGRLSSAILVVEYTDDPEGTVASRLCPLHELARALGPRGYSHVTVVGRDGFEILHLGSLPIRAGDRGTALFLHHGIFPTVAPVLYEVLVEAQTTLLHTARELRRRDERRLETIAELKGQIALLRSEIAELEPSGSWSRFRRRWLRPRLGTLRHHPPRSLVIPARYHHRPPLSSPPLMSVVTATLDSVGFVERTIRSVLDQGYPALEYVIQDGGSSDGTLTILDRYRPAVTSLQVGRDRGQADALNLAFARTTGEIMAYLNADDLFLPSALHYVAWFFTTHPEVDVLYGHRVLVDEYDQEIGRWVLPPHDSAILSWADYIPQETLYWRRRIWDRVGGRFDETFQFALDWDLLLRFRASGARFVRVPRFLGAFRVHDLQKTTAQMATVGAREMARLRERELGRPVSEHELRRRLRGFLARSILYQKLYRTGVFRY